MNRSAAAPSRGGRGSPSRGSAERSQPRASFGLSRSPALLAPSERVLGRHLGEDQGEAVGIARDHLEEAPRLHLGLLLDRYAPLRQPFPDGVEVAHLEEEANSVLGRLGRGARDLEEAAAEKEDDAAGLSLAPLAVDGEAKCVLVEAERALELLGTKEDAAREDLHPASLAPARSHNSSLGAHPGFSRARPGGPEIQKSVATLEGGDSPKAIERDLTHP
jgi:hypothetical protein